MMLFDKDYTKLTPEVETELKKYSGNKQILPLTVRVPKFDSDNEYSKDFWRYIDLFPNHLLIDPKFCSNKKELRHTLDEFKLLIENNQSLETGILNFIRDKKAYFIIASLLKKYDFGHHDRYIFPEFPLGTSFTVDFLIIGRGSGGYRFIFVEIENIYGRIINKKGELGEVYRKGLNQIEDWNSWLDANFSQLKETFKKYLGQYGVIPNELINYDKTRINFVVIAGRRSDYMNKTYTIRRRKEINQIRIYHYDNLIDFAEELIRTGEY